LLYVDVSSWVLVCLSLGCFFFFFFFFQAEDGIRDWSVTGVQTCGSSDLPCSSTGLSLAAGAPRPTAVPGDACMPHRRLVSRGLLAATVALTTLGACPPAWASGEAAVMASVREPAVAGLFYPKDPADLSKLIDACLAAAQAQPVGELRALVCPHAGYPYSGPVAAYA